MDSLLLLPNRIRNELETLATIGYPDEACGLLLGRRESGHSRVEIQHATRNANLQHVRDCFAIDPRDYLVAERQAGRMGMALIGVWHTHSDHPARPSESDYDMAWSGWSYVILAVNSSGVVDLRSWRLVDGTFFEEAVSDA